MLANESRIKDSLDRLAVPIYREGFALTLDERVELLAKAFSVLVTKHRIRTGDTSLQRQAMINELFNDQVGAVIENRLRRLSEVS